MKPKLSKWIKWRPKEKNAGVYLLGIFDKAPSKVNPTDKNIVYIGETCKSLNSRWRQFERSAFKRLNGHSGGKTFANKRCNKKNLWVSYFTPSDTLNKEQRTACIRYVERLLIWNFVKKHKGYPKCNRK